jgi:glycosyltransferase involved in cell wall biosynthesis
MHGMTFGWKIKDAIARVHGNNAEIDLLKKLSKKIVYSQNGCHDGVSQTEFSKWGPESVCTICRWQHEPEVCSDGRNLDWGRFRNTVSDYQCSMGINRVDWNDDPRVHATPGFFCLDPETWHPDIEIPDTYRLAPACGDTVRLYHAVGHRKERTREDGSNIKSTHIYHPLVERLRADGLNLELLEPTGIPNIEVRFLQVQADIFLDMLTYGWFGANAREAMMLGKPVICFIRPEWLDSLREELPEYAATLPVVNATPDTVESVLRDLIADPAKRADIGRRSREFAIKWHSAKAGARHFDRVYRALLSDDPLLRRKDMT